MMRKLSTLKLGLFALAVALIIGCGPTTSTAPEVPSGSFMINNGNIRVNLKQAPSLQKVGGVAKITNPSLSEPIIVLRMTEKGFIALSLTCTTKGNELDYLPEEKKFKCMGTGIEVAPDARIIDGKPDKKIMLYPASLAIFDRDMLIIRVD